MPASIAGWSIVLGTSVSTDNSWNRRKKVRCPSERPACSNCVRLSQHCAYTSPIRPSRTHHSEERLASLEEKLDLLISGNLPNRASFQEQPLRDNVENRDTSYSATPPSATDPRDGSHSFFPFRSGSRNSRLRPQPSDIAVAMNIYFKHCHRQPIWCFERDEVQDHGSLPDDLVYSILSLASRYFQNPNQSQTYGGYAKNSIMFRIAEGSVELETIESLCLLSFSSFIDGAIQLGQFDLGLAFQLCRSAMLDLKSTYTVQDPTTERKKRLFWSLQVLEQSYGRHTGVLSVPTDVWRPSYFSSNSDKRSSSGLDSEPRPLPLPEDNLGCALSGERGIWNTSVHLGWVWNRVRKYVSDCAQNILKEPWRHDSTYSTVNADFMETEHKIPMSHRWDSVKFYERTAEELEINRDYWGPWLKEQFTYNCILAVLNHPFLYIVGAQHNPDLAIPNTFWRRSSELALIHSTWTVRLIDMIWDKQMTLYDPFYGHAAAIAATIHLYYCCAANARLRLKSIADFAKCRKFLKSFLPFSPACEALDRSLEQMTQIAVGSETVDVENWMPSKIYLSIPLMWDILQFNCKLDSQEISTNGPLSPSLTPTITHQDTDHSSIIEVIVATSPDITVNTADGGQAQPIVSFTAPAPPVADSSRNTMFAASSDSGGDGTMADSLTFSTTPWLWADPSQSGNISNLGGSTLSLPIGDAEGVAWWDVRNSGNAAFNFNQL